MPNEIFFPQGIVQMSHSIEAVEPISVLAVSSTVSIQFVTDSMTFESDRALFAGF